MPLNPEMHANHVGREPASVWSVGSAQMYRRALASLHQMEMIGHSKSPVEKLNNSLQLLADWSQLCSCGLWSEATICSRSERDLWISRKRRCTARLTNGSTGVVRAAWHNGAIKSHSVLM